MPLKHHLLVVLGSSAVLTTACTEPKSAGQGMVISAELLEFGVVPIDTVSTLDLTIENAGGDDFELLSATVIEGTSSLWSIAGSDSTTLTDGDIVTISVSFSPYDQGAEEGRLQLRTTWEDSPNVYISLLAEGGASITDSDGDGLSSADGDCDDSDATVYPGAEELCDGQDNDCDGEAGADEVDVDYDGWLLCNGDCNDEEETIYPGAEEICDDTDTDCDGVNNDRQDRDFDGFSLCTGDCDDTEPDVHPGNPELCDGFDNDCTGDIDDIDDDGDGYSPCDNGGDCDDTDYFAYPVVVDLDAELGGDGSWDDPYDSLDAAFAGLDEVCRTVVLSEGSYTLERSWTSGDVTLVGAGLEPSDTVLMPPKDGTVFSVSAGSHLTLRNLRVTGASSSEDGGALRADGADLSLERVLLDGNVCTDCDGGAIAVSSGTLTLDQCTLSGNSSGDDGGAIVILFGSLIDRGSIYDDNKGARGGAIRAESSSVILDGVLFDGNDASSEGGAISLVGGQDHLIERSDFWANTAAIYGGAISMTGVVDEDSLLRNLIMIDNIAGSSGGGVSVTGASAAFQLMNSSLIGNKSDNEGAGIYMAAASADGVQIWSNIAYFNDGASGIYVATDSGASIAYNVAFATTGGSAYNYVLSSGEDGGENLAADPQLTGFINNGDPTDDDVSLLSGSPAINSGPQSGEGPAGYTWADTDGSRNDRGAYGGQGAQ
ncbi:MAG: hypothetical protein ACI8S6_002580 [Myxococcota bacterium]|jgi:hypothetical protein